MINTKIIKGMIAASVLTVSMVTAANAAVSCPSADDVKGADRALNAVIRQGQKSFFVLTAQPAVRGSGLGWIVASQASGSGFDAAYNAGKSSVQSVIAAAMNTPIEQQGMYICPYLSSSGGMGVMAVAPKQQGLVFNPSLLDMGAIKAKM